MLSMKSIRANLREYTSFLICGGLNTLLTYAVYALCLLFWPYKLSYSLSYVSGIFISYYLNSRFVFQEKVSLGKFLQYPLVYLAQYLLGIAILHLCIEYLHISEWLAPFIVIVLSLPVTFVLSKFIIKGKAKDLLLNRSEDN